MQLKEKSLDSFLKNGEGYRPITPKHKKIVDLFEFDETDWTFKTADTREFTHAIYNEYPARMIPQIARRLIDWYYPTYDDSQHQKPMLDPFAGSGTTCVEGLLKNIDSIAFDLNPLANLIEKVRTSIVKPDFLQEKYQTIMDLIKSNKTRNFPQYLPQIDNLAFWYSDHVLRQLTVIRYAIETAFSQDDPDDDTILNAKDFFLLCYGKITRDCSYQRKKEHKTYRMKAEDIPSFDESVNVIKAFKGIFQIYFQGKVSLYNYYTDHSFSARCNPRIGNSMLLEGVEDNSIDLIVTSPPYGDSHTTVAYGQFSRFALEWLLFDSKEVRDIDNQLLGGEGEINGYVESGILLNCCKDILREEIIQELTLLDSIYSDTHAIPPENLPDFSDFDDALKNIGLLMTDIHNQKESIDDITTFDELIEVKENYFALLKEIRTIWNSVGKRINPLIQSRFKIYEDRLGYVLSFFHDFFQVFQRLYQVLDADRMCCIVIGNRTVKGIQIPTDEIIVELGKTLGFEHVITYYRQIPSKRMPKKNSPTNIPGKKSTTIENESIIVLKKPYLVR